MAVAVAVPERVELATAAVLLVVVAVVAPEDPVVEAALPETDREIAVVVVVSYSEAASQYAC